MYVYIIYTYICVYIQWDMYHIYIMEYIYIYISLSHLLYPFICQWTFRLLPCLRCCKWCCNEISGLSGGLILGYRSFLVYLTPNFFLTASCSIEVPCSYVPLKAMPKK